MEFIKGEELSSLLRRIGRLPRDKAIQIARQICAGLSAAHEVGVMHRDLKPSNIMIDEHGNVRITDFGLAGLEEELHGQDMIAGTPAYMAPEQLEGQTFTVRSDIYSLGLLLYELFTGKKAFDARYHMVREAERSAGNINKIETIIVGQETFMKMGDGPWRKFPVNVGELIAQFRDPKVIDELSKRAEVKFVGPDTVDGSATMVYQYTYSDPEGKGVKTTAKTWIGVANNLPLRTESEAESEIMGKKINSKSTITYYDYNADIKIERPTQ